MRNAQFNEIYATTLKAKQNGDGVLNPWESSGNKAYKRRLVGFLTSIKHGLNLGRHWLLWGARESHKVLPTNKKAQTNRFFSFSQSWKRRLPLPEPEPFFPLVFACLTCEKSIGRLALGSIPITRPALCYRSFDGFAKYSTYA